MITYRKNFVILFRKSSRPHRVTFCVRLSRKSADGKWMKRVFCGDKMFAKCCFLRRHFAPLADGAKRFQGSVSPELTSSCKISSQSVPVCRSYFRESDFIWTQCLWHIVLVVCAVSAASWRNKWINISLMTEIINVGYDLKSNDLKSRFEIKFSNCDFDFKSFSNNWF